jgi:WD40 repeat protein
MPASRPKRNRALIILILALLVVALLFLFFHTHSPTLEQEFTPHPGVPDTAIFAPDNKRPITTSEGETCLWDISTGRKLTTFQSNAGPIVAEAISPTGNFWACTRGRYVTKKQMQFTLEIWNLNTAACLSATLPQGSMNSPQANAIAFSPDELTIAVALPSSQIGFFSVSSASLTNTWQRPTPTLAITYSPDGKLLASAEGAAVQVLSTVTGQPISTLTKPGLIGIYALHFWPDSKTLSAVVGLSFQNAACVWDTQTTSMTKEIDFHDGSSQPSFSADGQTLAISSDSQSFIVGTRWRVHIFNLSKGEEISTTSGTVPLVSSLALSPDAAHLAIGHFGQYPNASGVVQIYSIK